MEKIPARDWFSGVARNYDAWMSHEEYRAPGMIADQVRSHFSSLGKNSPFILDIGAGTGLLGEELKQRMPKANLTAIDLSSEMLREANKKRVYFNLHAAPVPSGLARFSDGMFNAVVSCGATEYIGDTDGIAEETSRVLKPGGIVCMSFLLSTKPYLDAVNRSSYCYPKVTKAESQENVDASFRKHGIPVKSGLVTTGYNDKGERYAPDYYIVMAVKEPG